MKKRQRKKLCKKGLHHWDVHYHEWVSWSFDGPDVRHAEIVACKHCNLENEELSRRD